MSLEATVQNVGERSGQSLGIKNYPDHLIGARVITTVVLDIDEYQNKEDSQGGPGYYPRHRVIARKERTVQLENVISEVAKVYG